MAKTTRPSGTAATPETLPEAVTVPDDQHPDFIGGTLGEETDPKTLTPIPGGPLPGPLPGPIPGPFPHIPTPLPQPFPFPRFCGAVSGRYRYRPPIVYPTLPQPGPVLPGRPVVPGRFPMPVIPINLLSVIVRVDVDRFYPQKRISIEVSRLFPNSTSHAIAEVTSDRCTGYSNRTILANIIYRDGNAALIPGTTITFQARRTTGFNYGAYEMELSGGGISPKTYTLVFESKYFDKVEFEVDSVANAGSIVTAMDTGDHPNRPADLPDETLSLATIYQRAGFNVSMSPNTTVIPTSGAGSNGTWSDTEMHNAMVTFWSRFANKPNWALWVLYAARHDQGRSLGGVMFDDIGPNHRQGTAIFTDSFIQDAPPGDPNAPAWRQRMEFWTAVHEMGHAFNLAHAWQKAMGSPQGAPGDPWIPLANAPESRSFMNYPFRVSGGESSFFGDFRFRFSDDELIFMRHAPRRFVQMGNSDWFVNHGFEAPDAMRLTGTYELEVRPNRASTAYRFLEPVTMELKLTNTSGAPVLVDGDMLSDGGHVTIFLQREGGLTKQWRPMMTRCLETHDDTLDPGKSIYGAHMISTSTSGWMIDEPGFYKIQAAVDMGDEIVVSNVLRVYVGPPMSHEESAVAPDYFTEGVGRVLSFGGAPTLEGAQEVLQKVAKTCANNPAAIHAEVALNSPLLRDFKVLDPGADRADMAIRTLGAKTGTAAKTQVEALLKEPDVAADTMGHISYFVQLREVAEALEEAGDTEGAVKIMSQTIDMMRKRDILESVIGNAEARLKRRS